MEQDSIIDNAITNVRGNAAGICASQPLKAGCASSTKGLAPPALCQDSHPTRHPICSLLAPNTPHHSLPPRSSLAVSAEPFGSSSATDAQAAAAGDPSSGGATFIHPT